MSLTAEKPSRYQAWIALSPYCSGIFSSKKKCHQGDAVKYAMCKLGDTLAGKESYSERCATDYVQSLASSKLVMCPSGKNPEQYRIWEAIMSGAIPVVEKSENILQNVLHPSYGLQFFCSDSYTHWFLRHLKAPVLFVKDWERDIPSILSMSDEKLQIIQNDLYVWYYSMIQTLRQDLLFQIVNYFA